MNVIVNLKQLRDKGLPARPRRLAPVQVGVVVADVAGPAEGPQVVQVIPSAARVQGFDVVRFKPARVVAGRATVAIPTKDSAPGALPSGSAQACVVAAHRGCTGFDPGATLMYS